MSQNANVIPADLIPISKSLLIRKAVLDSYASLNSINYYELDIEQVGYLSDDARLAFRARDLILRFLKNGDGGLFDHLDLTGKGGGKSDLGIVIDAGHSAAVLRFFALRLSRIPGAHYIRASSRLLLRPHEELASIGRQLGFRVESNSHGLVVVGNGWERQGPWPLIVDGSFSSQFVSALLLNLVDCKIVDSNEQKICIEVRNDMVSEPYIKMTLNCLATTGLDISSAENIVGGVRITRYTIGSGPLVNNFNFLEPDAGCCAALAIVAVALSKRGTEVFLPGTSSMQPDQQYLAILQRIGLNIHVVTSTNRVKIVNSGAPLSPLFEDLNACPDLFPCLAALSAFLSSPSKPSVFSGIRHLAFKESHRIEKIRELLTMCGVSVEWDGTYFRVYGFLEEIGDGGLFSGDGGRDFDCADDHRLAMAAGVLLAGISARASLRNESFSNTAEIRIRNSKVVSKSFPNFWEILEKYFNVRSINGFQIL